MIYLASRYERKDEMHEKAEILREMGFRIISRWHSIPPDFKNAAQIDIKDIHQCNMIVMFTENREDLPKANSGGRHFELGYAYSKSKIKGKPKIIIIGEVENAFHLLPGIRRFPSWEDFLTFMEENNESSGIRAPT